MEEIRHVDSRHSVSQFIPTNRGLFQALLWEHSLPFSADKLLPVCVMPPADNLRLSEDILPAELWSECWHFVDIKDIWNVRLVCKQFARTGQTFLYRVLHCWSPNQEDVDNNNWDMWCKHFLWSATRFVVVSTGNFVYHVEEWSFSGIEHTRSLNDTNANIRGIGVLVEAYQSALTIFLNTLPLYPKLTTITLTSIRVDKSVFEALDQISTLSNLSLIETNTIIRPIPSSISPWNLQKLRIVTNERQDPDDIEAAHLSIASPTTLGSLVLNSYEFAEACLRPLVVAGMSFEMLSHLSLNLSLRTLGLLRDTLQLCPLLETLDINDIDYNDVEGLQYPTPSSHCGFPRILNYHGPAHLASKTLAACPFKNLSIHNGKSKENTYGQCEMQRLLKPLAHHNPVHLSLSVVYPDTQLCDTLSTIFSNITSLHICYNDPEPHYTPINDGSRYREVVLIGGHHSFMWPIRPRNTMMVCRERENNMTL